MKINIQLSENFRTSSSISSKLYINGRIFIGDQPLSDTDLIKGLENYGVDFIKQLNGFYAFIFINNQLNIAVVDIIRSIPIFYSIDEASNQICVSDVTQTLNNNNNIDTINKEIFQLCSYVIGNETLYTNIYQILAGNYLNITNHDVQTINYFKYEALEPSSKFNKDTFITQVHLTIKTSFKRLINYANGRQLVIPLSGGYDSRLIASAIKSLSYNNVLCFSYGAKGNLEAEYSKKIAESLELKWIFIEYTPEKWRKSWNSPLSKEFVKFASHDSALPHIQDWLAIKEIKERGLVDKDAVFVPGHCCVTGYIGINDIDKQSKELSLDTIISRHFSISPISETEKISNSKNLKIVIADKISEQIDLNDNLPNCVTIYNWQERQSKYIANSVRAYEFFGYDWWLPLWDKEFVNIWMVLPNQERVNRLLFKSIVASLYSRTSGEVTDLGNASTPSLGYSLARGFLKLMPSNINLLLKSIYRKNEYLNHPLELGSIVPRKRLKLLTYRGYKINGIYSKIFLEDYHNQ